MILSALDGVTYSWTVNTVHSIRPSSLSSTIVAWPGSEPPRPGQPCGRGQRQLSYLSYSPRELRIDPMVAPIQHEVFGTGSSRERVSVCSHSFGPSAATVGPILIPLSVINIVIARVDLGTGLGALAVHPHRSGSDPLRRWAGTAPASFRGCQLLKTRCPKSNRPKHRCRGFDQIG